MRILVEPALRIGHADQFEGVERDLARFLRRLALVMDHRLGDLVADGKDRV
ncbi:hypothetical protein D9M70_537620 [compost metagenome]